MHTSVFSSIFVYLSQVISSSRYWTMLSHIADFPSIVQAYAQHRYSFILIIAITTVELRGASESQQPAGFHSNWSTQQVILLMSSSPLLEVLISVGWAF